MGMAGLAIGVRGWGRLIGGMDDRVELDRHRKRVQPRVERQAEDFVELCDAIEPRLLRRGKRDTNATLQDSSNSILANIGEGWDEPSPGDKIRFFRYAARSAGECERALVRLRSTRILTEEELRHGFKLLLGIKMDLRRLIAHFTP